MRRYNTTGNTTLFDKEDTEHKLILTQEVTPASVHDSQPMDTLLVESEKGPAVVCRQRVCGSGGDAVEHIFGFMENMMHRLYIRTIGLARATAVIGLINLTYNMSRYEQIVRLNLIETKN